MKSAIEDKRLKQLRADAQAVLDDAHGYRPWDRETKLGQSPWKGTPELLAWEAAHGHDPRSKCYAEYGCQLLEVEGAENTLVLLSEIERLRSRREVEQDCTCAQGPTSDGPEETCPRDGRTYAEWVQIASDVIGQNNALRDRLAAAERTVRLLIRENVDDWGTVPCSRSELEDLRAELAEGGGQ